MTFRRIRTSSSSWRPKPCSSPGTASAPSITATLPASPTIWAPPSTSSPWSSATWARTPAPAWPSPATPPTGEHKMYGDYLLNAQGEDVVAGIRNTEKIENLGKDMPEAYPAVPGNLPTSWKSTTTICRMSSSPSSTASCGCCRPATASAPPRPRSRSLWIWRTKA